MWKTLSNHFPGKPGENRLSRGHPNTPGRPLSRGTGGICGAGSDISRQARREIPRQAGDDGILINSLCLLSAQETDVSPSRRQLLQHHQAGDALRRGPSGSPRGVVRGLAAPAGAFRGQPPQAALRPRWRFETPQRALGTFARSKVPASPGYACRQVLI